MTDGYTIVPDDKKLHMLQLYEQWLNLSNYLIDAIKARWHVKRVCAHYDDVLDQILVLRLCSQARVFREKGRVFFVNGAREKLGKIEESIEEWPVGVVFDGWEHDKSKLEDIEYFLHEMIAEFVSDAQLLWDSEYALENFLQDSEEN